MTKTLILTSIMIASLFSSSNAAESTVPDSSAVVKTDTVPNWKTSGMTSLMLNQLSLVNWTKGGENALSGIFSFKYNANYAKDGFAWDNSLLADYGLQQTDDNPIRKNQDRIDFSTKLGYKAVTNFYYTVLGSFKSQFASGYKYPDDSTVVSRFFSPAYLILSMGIDFKYKDIFSFYLSPMTGKMTFVSDTKLADLGTYTSEPAKYDTNGVLISHGEKIVSNFGAFMKASFKKNIMENVNLSSKVELFNNYTDKIVDNRLNVDVDWETAVTMKVNEFISANIFAHLIYDHDIKVPLYETIDGVKTKTGDGRRLQFKEALGVGLSYKF
ncbi:MAG: DUF3078 domain-containing protein [Chlorobi bacterium]|nr:DUF3078 domain-containing protein [Chlorobiota bacterium]